MSAYLATMLSRTSSATPDAGIKVEAAEDGTVLFRRDRAVTVYGMNLVHEWLDQDQLDELMDFIETDGYGPHTVTVRGIDYIITLINDPEVVEHKGPLHMVVSKAIGVKA